MLAPGGSESAAADDGAPTGGRCRLPSSGDVSPIGGQVTTAYVDGPVRIVHGITFCSLSAAIACQS